MRRTQTISSLPSTGNRPTFLASALVVVAFMIGACAGGSSGAENDIVSALQRDQLFRFDVPGGTPGQLLASGGHGGTNPTSNRAFRTWDLPTGTASTFAEMVRQAVNLGVRPTYLLCRSQYSLTGTKAVGRWTANVMMSLGKSSPASGQVTMTIAPGIAQPAPVAGPATVGKECPQTVRDALGTTYRFRPRYLPDGLGYERTVLDSSSAVAGGANEVSFYDDLVGAVPADGKVLPPPKRLIVVNVITGPAKVGEFADAPADRRATVRGQPALVIPQGDEVGLKWVEDSNTTIFMSGKGIDVDELNKVADSLERGQK